MTFFETTAQQNKLATIGREMMNFSEYYGNLSKLTDDQLRTLNDLSHVGHMLTRFGTTFGVTVADFTDQDRKLIVDFINNKLNVQ